MTPRPAETTSCPGSGRERLLEAAVRLFCDRGYAATTVRDIVAAAGVKAPALYHHFGSKEGLLLAIVGAGRQRVEAVRRAALEAGGSAADRILRLARAYTALRREYRELASALEQVVASPAAGEPPHDLRAMALEKLHLFEQMVEEGTASGEFRPCSPRPVALAIVGALEVVARPHLFDEGGGGADGDLEGMLAVILGGIAARREAAASNGGPAPA